MLGHYTTGLRFTIQNCIISVITLTLPRTAILLSQRFSDAVAFLTNPVPAATTPQRVYYRIFVLRMTSRAKNPTGIIV
ncbi:MAG TPA: hypothetical protein VGB11_06335 [Candidatus Bathyarchaeia archaeon]